MLECDLLNKNSQIEIILDKTLKKGGGGGE